MNEQNTFNVPTLQVSVSQHAIDSAEQNDSGKCVVAQELRRMGYRSIRVDNSLIRFNNADNTIRYMYTVPPKAVENIMKFDAEGRDAIKPFKFTLDGRYGGMGPVRKVRNLSGKKRGVKVTPRAYLRVCKRRYHGLAQVDKIAGNPVYKLIQEPVTSE